MDFVRKMMEGGWQFVDHFSFKFGYQNRTTEQLD